MKFADFRQVTRSWTSPVPVSSRSDLARMARDLVQGVFPLPKQVRLLGVTVSSFDGASLDQIGLDFS